MSDQVTTSREERANRAAERRRARASALGFDTRWWGTAAAICFAVLIVLAIAVDAFASAGRIHPGVKVAGVSVGGMKQQTAEGFIAAQLTSKTSEPVTVSYKGHTWTVNASDLGLTFDYPALAKQAMEVGRTGGPFGVVGGRVGAWFGKVDLSATPSADPAKAKVVLDKVAADTDVAPVDASLKIKGTTITVTPSADGVGLDRAELTTRMLAGFLGSERAMTAPVVTAKPKVADSAADQARVVVVRMVSQPATVQYKDKTWTFSRDELAQMIVLKAIEPSATAGGAAAATGWTLDPSVSAAEASNTIQPKLGVALGTPPVSARFKTSNGSVTIIPSKQGIGPDSEKLAADLTAALKSDPSVPRVVTLQTKISDPALTTAQANAMGIQHRISTFTTTYGQVPQRVNNIHVLGSALDGKLVPPGGTFSFNGYVGERTAAKGYQEANAIVKGKLVPQMGGGICQVATTLFNTVFVSGLPIVERENHSFYISHYPTGRDATVSWGGPDLKWKNSTGNWILISVSYTSDSITISLYGTSPGYDVTYTTGPFTNSVPYKTQTISDPTLPAGVKEVVDTGVNGCNIVVTRTVKKDGAVVRTDTFQSHYTPKDATVRVGPAKGNASKSATSSVTTKKP